MRVVKPSFRRQVRGTRTRGLLVAGGLLVLIFTAGTIRATQRKNRVHRELAELQREIQTFQQENARLEQWLGYLSSDAFVTAEARRSLGLGRPGEQPVVVAPTTAPADQPAPTGAPTPAPPLPSRWWEYFFGEP